MSILQGYLLTYGVDATVKYWNIFFSDITQNFANKNNEISDITQLIPFLGNIALKLKDDLTLNKLIDEFRSIFPQYINIDKYYYMNKITQESEVIDKMFYDELLKISIQDYDLVGVSSKFHQWITGNILAKHAKEINSKLKFVLGGLGNKKEAMAMMKNFEFYDFAIWGEGEYPLLQLSRYLNNEIVINEVPNLLYKGRGAVLDTKITNKHYLNLDEILPVHFDYFSQQKTKDIDSVEVQIEGGRGCHWNKCHFCFLNSGYRFRTKSSKILSNEIIDIIDKYSVTDFVFVDNDIIGDNIEKFDQLLDSLIDIKEHNDSFKIVNAEVITYGVESKTIKKMALAGFISVQIGYEAISDNLLTKIKKKNTFSSNLSFIKWAIQFNIKVEGANLIPNLLEESDEDILITSEHLHFLRFFLKRGKFQHSFSPLAIASSSRYFKIIQQNNETDRWSNYKLANLLPTNYFNESDRFDILFYGENNVNPLWKNVKKNEIYYLDNDYKYQLLTNNNQIDYREFYNGELVKCLQFKNDSIHWKILVLCNYKVMSIIELMDIMGEKTDLVSLKSILKELNNEWLMYSKEDYSENITIINTDLIL
jgi:radical SAM superfamily enzyme YgiQ (UPF0313 family)